MADNMFELVWLGVVKISPPTSALSAITSEEFWFYKSVGRTRRADECKSQEDTQCGFPKLWGCFGIIFGCFLYVSNLNAGQSNDSYDTQRQETNTMSNELHSTSIAAPDNSSEIWPSCLQLNYTS